MADLSPDLTLRPPTLNDAPAVHALISTREIHDHGEPDETLEEVGALLEDLDLSHNAWLYHTSQGDLVAFAYVAVHPEGCNMQWYIHPEYASLEMDERILKGCESRIAHLLAAGETTSARSWTYISTANTSAARAAKTAGYLPEKYYFRMQAESAAAPPAPEWPPGAALRTMRPEEEGRRVFDFIYRAFDWHGRGDPPDYDWWRDFMMRPDHYHPELWFLLERQGEIIAAALCYDYPENGWVRQLAVDPALRRQGLGSSMLRHVFRFFFQRGQPKVSLVVDSTNPDARDFYENVGMRQERLHIEYAKIIKQQVKNT